MGAQRDSPGTGLGAADGHRGTGRHRQKNRQTKSKKLGLNEREGHTDITYKWDTKGDRDNTESVREEGQGIRPESHRPRYLGKAR